MRAGSLFHQKDDDDDMLIENIAKIKLHHQKQLEKLKKKKQEKHQNNPFLKGGSQ